nr:MAG TPA: hypothetical protein [Caudoviricetes sp.]
MTSTATSSNLDSKQDEYLATHCEVLLNKSGKPSATIKI